MKTDLLDDFGPELFESLEKVLAHGLKKEGRYRGQWKTDKDSKFHVSKAIGHACQHGKIDEDGGEPNLSNAIVRLMIAWVHEREEAK